MATKYQREQRTGTLLVLSGCAREAGRDISQAEISADLDTLHRAETTLSRVNENECDGWPKMVRETRDGRKYEYAVTDDAWQARDQRTEARAQAQVREICEKYGIPVRFDGDPRGGAVRLVLPDGRSNGWDNETWGIYW